MVFLLGLIPHLIVSLFIINKKLRDDKRIIKAIILTIPLALFALYKKIEGIPFTSHSRPSDTFFCPLVTILTYTLFRFFYKKIYNVEPTYWRPSWYDPEDRRNQNLLDFITMVGPFVIGGLFPLAIN